MTIVGLIAMILSAIRAFLKPTTPQNGVAH